MPTAEQLDESPTPSPNPFRNPFGLGFRPATPDALQSSPLPSPSQSPESSLDDPEDLASDSADDWDVASSPESLDDTPSRASTPDSDPEAVKVELFDEETLQQLARAGVMAAGEKAHELAATSPGQKHVGLYLTDEHDQANIGNPLAKIAARHQGIAGKVNPDTQDFLAAMVGVFGYATKQINRRAEARALDAGAAAGQPAPAAVDL